jgi:DNA-binding MarR family transcriptional regulator
MIGSLLRFPHEVVMTRMLAALNQQGHNISPTELRVLLYPGPDGKRPIDLARQCDMTRQAMNYVLSSLESRGYIERNTVNANTSVVQLTDRGRELVPVIRGCIARIENEWTLHLGRRRFEALRATLVDLSTWLGKLD